MSRLDQHIAAVQNKLALGLFVRVLAWIALGYTALVWLIIIAERSFDRTLPRHGTLFLIGCGACVVGAFVYAFVRRPTQKMAAVAIDETLGLKEKFTTALYMRPMKDPFAAAAVRDAEHQANNVSLYKRFPIKIPKVAGAAAAVALGAFLTGLLMPTLHLFATPVAPKTVALTPEKQTATQKFVAEQLPKIEASMVDKRENTEAIKRAMNELNRAAKTTEGDEARNKRSALQALQDMKKAITDQIDKNEKVQTAEQEKQQLSQMSDAKDESTPIGKAQNELKAGDLDAAMNDISKAVANFDKMKPEDQEKMTKQAEQLAQELSKAANDPKVQQKVTQQLMQMGANQTQAQQMAAAMQQAAQGDKAAAQQLQQAAQQLQSQMNNGQGPTPQQQQQIQKMMAQMQGATNSQAQANALAGSAKQLASAMQQASAQQQGQSGQQGQPKPGPGQQQGAGQMQAAQQQMQQQLNNMQAQAKDAQQMKAAADAAGQAAQQEAGGLNPGQGQNQGQGNNPGQGQGSQANGNGQGQGKGQGQGQGQGSGQNPGGGQGGQGPGGGQMPIAEAPSDFKQEMDAGKENEGGRVLASRYVKAGIDPGKSTAGLKQVATSAEKEAPDEIDPEHVSRDAQSAVKEYFSAMQKQDGQ